MTYLDRLFREEVMAIAKRLNHEFLHSEKSKQGTSPEPLVSDDTQLGTGCSSESSGATKDEGLDAAPLGHKIEPERLICVKCGHSSYIRKSVISGEIYCQQCWTDQP